jgi:XRE family aerobic/anaerobic benzoate catabolism transcriptional regulator
MSETAPYAGQAKPAADRRGGRNARFERLLSTVGSRIQCARKRAGLSRRQLSEQSRVSQRYIAQLETGQGNISIGLLMQLADALDLRMDSLVCEDGPQAGKRSVAAELLASASDDQLAQILAILDPAHSPSRRANRIAFIGLRGAGKSTLGRLSAERLGIRFMELNDEIELASGMAVHEVIALYGQEGYRHLEYDALGRIARTHERLVLAVAGGIVSHAESYDYLLRNYHAMWLKAEPEEHMARVRGQGDERPMAGNPDAMEELRKILTSREVRYARAAASVDTSGRTLDESLASVLRTIEDQGFLKT